MLSLPHGAEPEEKPLLWTSEYGTKMEEGMASGSEGYLTRAGHPPVLMLCVFTH